MVPSRSVRVYVLQLLVACGSASPPSVPEGVTRGDLNGGCEVKLAAEPALLAYVEESAARWSLATGCDVRLADGGVEFRLASDLPFGEGGKQVPAWTRDDRKLVLVHARARETQRARSVPHELGHVLGGLHTLSDGVLSGGKQRRDVIDVEALDSVCRVLDCRALNPEDGR